VPVVLKLCLTVLICFINSSQTTCLTIILCASFIQVTDGSIRVSRSFTGGLQPPCPPGYYSYMIMIIKMIEIYNIVAQPYYCWWTHAYCIETIAPRTPNTYLLSEKKMLCYQLCSTHYAAIRINNHLKRTFVIKVATMDNFHNKWHTYHKIDTFCGEQRWMGHKGGLW